MRRGSALLMALWIILVLGVIAMSFAFEARLQGGVNIYVQNKNRVKRLVESGRVLGEVVLIGYDDAKEWQDGEDTAELFEDDRWYLEKRKLKFDSSCKVGPILLDEEDKDSGTIEVEISISHGLDGSGININKLYDDNSLTRWQIILDLCGVPREDDFRTEEGKTINLQHHVFACWKDYRDEDDTRSAVDGQECGAEKSDYVEYYDDHEDEIAEEDRLEPANGEITDIKELSRVLCFREYPALLTGGVINPWEDKMGQITVRGLLHMGFFGTSGSEKINVNDCTVNQLMTVPGVIDEDEMEEDNKTATRELAQAIVDGLKRKPENYEVDETRDWWPYKDWSDLRARLEESNTEAELGDEAQQYLEFAPSKESLFKMKITAAIMDMEYVAECEGYIMDKEIRYISWKE